MKVLLCKGSFFGSASGADQMIVNYALLLASAGVKPIVVVTCAYSKDDPYHHRLSSVGVPVVCLARHPVYLLLLALRRVALVLSWFPMLRAFRDWERLAYWTACFILWSHRPDLVHILVEGGIFLRAAHATGTPALFQECATPRYADRHDMHVMYDKLEAALPFCTTFVALSPRMAHLCRKRLRYEGSIGILPILLEDPAQQGGRTGPRVKGVTFGFSARIEHLKGVHVLVEAFSTVARIDPDVRLRMAGAGDEEQGVTRQLKELGIDGQVELVGTYTTDAGKRAFFGGIDVLVHPSLTEGTPCTIIEAMAFGLPVVATEVGGVGDMLTSDMGILIPPSDPQALAEAMKRLLQDPGLRDRMGHAARERYSELFSPEAGIPLLLDVYRATAETRQEHQVDRNEKRGQPTHPWAGIVA